MKAVLYSSVLLLASVVVSLGASIERKVASYDVAVYGGVPCGISAAIAAAREGARVLLIEPTHHIGGLSTSGLNTAETEHMLKWTFGGVAQEFYERLGRKMGQNGPAYFFLSGVAEKVYAEMLAEAKVPVNFGSRVESVTKVGAQIRSITLTDGSSIEAKVFVDAGYEGDLMARAGVSFVVGRESMDEFGESKAGITFDAPRKAVTVDEKGNLLPGISGWAKDYQLGAAHPGTMNYNWRLTFSNDPATRVPIPKPQNYDRNRFRLLENWLDSMRSDQKSVKLRDVLDLYPRAHGRMEVNNKQSAVISLGNFGMQFEYPESDYTTREKVIQDHTNYTQGLLYFLANDPSVPENLRLEMQEWGLHSGEFADNGHWPYQLYVREARRMRGEFVVTQKDVTEERRKKDSIAMGSHFVDCHHVQRLALSPTEFVNEGRIWLPSFVYQIPYRALLPKAEECRNLLVPGAASYSHVAFCTYRLESTWMMGGHAAGVAATMAAVRGQGVQEVDVEALQRRLREQKQVIDFIEGEAEQFPHKEDSTITR